MATDDMESVEKKAMMMMLDRPQRHGNRNAEEEQPEDEGKENCSFHDGSVLQHVAVFGNEVFCLMSGNNQFALAAPDGHHGLQTAEAEQGPVRWVT
jgi:hypothetical protein